MEEWKAAFLELWQTHSARMIGITIGLLVGILFLTIGFFKTIFLVFCVSLGYYLGLKIDNKEDLLELLERILPKRYY